MMELKRLRLDASFTVEGSFVFPFIILIIFSLISMTFQLHNDVKAQADSLQLSEYSRALRNADIDDNEAQERLELYEYNVLSGGYLYEAPRELRIHDSLTSFARREDILRTVYAIKDKE